MDISVIAQKVSLPDRQVNAVLKLLEEGATVPFIARYRKERTGGLDEVQITTIRDSAKAYRELEERRSFILNALREQGVLTEALRQQLSTVQSKTELEDLYLPFKPRRKTRAQAAMEMGLEPLAKAIFRQERSDPWSLAEEYLSPGKGPENAEDALQGARDIVAEWLAEHAGNRQAVRRLFQRSAVFQARLTRGKKDEEGKYRDYHDYREPVRSIPSHRALAAFRGEKEGLLKVKVVVEDDVALSSLRQRKTPAPAGMGEQLEMAVQDAWKRLLAPAMDSEFRDMVKQRADAEAISIFGKNARQLLMAPPLGQRRVLAIDPGFRTGCKVVCLDEQGALLHNETIYPHTGGAKAREAEAKIRQKVESYKIRAIAVGNGTAGRETLRFLESLRLDRSIPLVMVNESGASIYSASAVAREEFPDYDITVRGAVSIGRRLMDPLAELVKIDPKSIGVGQYQYDVDQKLLQSALGDTVVSCVNAVGVEVNTASEQLLTYVSGLGPALARNVMAYRRENGPFRDKKQLLKVPRLGGKAFEQCAGFLRVSGGRHPLDESAIHPERYELVDRMARDLACDVQELIGDAERLSQLDLQHYIGPDVGLPTLEDIRKELNKPGRDPRKSFRNQSFAEGINRLEDLRDGMTLPGVVTNITAFGCFVDIGVHQDGLVHISELANRFVKDPNEVVQLSQPVQVKVLSVDVQRKRIALSMKQAERG